MNNIHLKLTKVVDVLCKTPDNIIDINKSQDYKK